MHLWSADAPHALVCMEKQRLVFIENEKAEDPIACDAQICDFSDMQVTLVKIEEIMKSVDANLKPKDFITTLDQKQLKQLFDSLTKLTPKDVLLKRRPSRRSRTPTSPRSGRSSRSTPWSSSTSTRLSAACSANRTSPGCRSSSVCGSSTTPASRR